MQAAGLRGLKLQIAVASPDPQTCAFPRYRSFPGKLGHPNPKVCGAARRCGLPDRDADHPRAAPAHRPGSNEKGMGKMRDGCGRTSKHRGEKRSLVFVNRRQVCLLKFESSVSFEETTPFCPH